MTQTITNPKDRAARAIYLIVTHLEATEAWSSDDLDVITEVLENLGFAGTSDVGMFVATPDALALNDTPPSTNGSCNGSL